MPRAALMLLGRNLDVLDVAVSGHLSLLLVHARDLWKSLMPLWKHKNADLHSIADEVRSCMT